MSLTIPVREGSPRPEALRARPAKQTPAKRGARSWADTHVGMKVFAVSAALNLIAAWCLTYLWRVGNADALARTANASYVLFSRDPHLASIGFVWPVLPSVLQLPLLPLLHALGHPEFAGQIESALAGAGTLVVLCAILGRFGITGWTRLLWLGTAQLHPQFWYLSGSGLAEPLSTLFLMLAVLAFLSVTTDVLAPAALGLSLAAAFFVRYEVLSTTASVAAALLVQRWALPEARAAMIARSHAGLTGALSRLVKQDWPTLEARLLTVLAPIGYAIVLWVLASWIIMGDPFYFKDSVFSLDKAPDVPINNGPAFPLHAQIHAPLLALGYAVWRLLEVNPTLLIVSIPALFLALRTGNRRLLGLLIIVFGTLVLPTYEVYKGTLPGFMRYWSLTTPFALVIGAGLVDQLARDGAGLRWARPARDAIALLLVLSIGTNLAALTWDRLNGLDEQLLGAQLTGESRQARAVQAASFDYHERHDGPLVASLLDRYSAHGLTLIDTETGFSPVLFARHPERLVIASDRDFHQILADPQRYLSYIVVTNPHLAQQRDAVNQRYGGPSGDMLFDGRVPWTREVAQSTNTIEPWRVFAVQSHDGMWPPGPIVHARTIGARQPGTTPRPVARLHHTPTGGDSVSALLSVAAPRLHAIVVNPDMLHFGRQPMRAPGAAATVRVVNVSATPLRINVVVTGADRHDFVEQDTCGGAARLGAYTGCTITVTFAPRHGGTHRATLVVIGATPAPPHAARMVRRLEMTYIQGAIG